MTTRTATRMAAFIAAASLAASPAAAQTDTAKVAAPVTAAPAATAPAAAPAPRPRRNPNEITREQMLEKNARNVYDGIRAYRGSWLRPSRSLTSSTQQNPAVAVYRDGAPLSGGVSALRELPVESVSKVEYFEPNSAVQRFGTAASAGAIMVHSGSGG